MHPAVDAVRGTVAIERGPVVYVLESADQAPGIDLDHVAIDATRPLVDDVVESFLGQRTPLVRAVGIARDDSAWAHTGWKTLGTEPEPTGTPVELVAIPYALWANRGPSTMRTFIPMIS
jgi:hypothetical protein